MNSLDANRPELSYELESELARLSVHATDRDPNRKLAWVNSICILFLLVGITGSKPAPIELPALPQVEEVTAAVVEPLPPPAQAQSEQQQESINFSVPTIGNLLVPTAIAKAPPLAPLKPVAPLRTQPTVLSTTGKGGERPHPPYPKIALDQSQQGSVTLRMTVDEAGTVTSVEISRSSGFPILDRNALDFVKRHWIIPAGTGSRVYEATIDYKLQMN